MSANEIPPEDMPSASDPVPQSLPGLVGTRRSAFRFKAMIMDDLISILFFFICVAGIKSLKPHSNTMTMNLVAGLIAYAFYLFYYFIFEACFAATPGKAYFGLTVRQLDGTRCTVRSAFIRALTRIIELNPLVLGYLPAAIVCFRSKRKQRLGDMLAGTVVVEKRVADAALSANSNAP